MRNLPDLGRAFIAAVTRRAPPADPLDLATAERLREERLAEHQSRQREAAAAERATDEAALDYLRDRLRVMRGLE